MASQLSRTISLSNILLIIATGFLVVLLWQLRSLLVTPMIAVVVAAAKVAMRSTEGIAPLIDAGERLRFPRWLAVITVYLSLLGG